MSFRVVWNPRPVGAIDAAWNDASAVEQARIANAIENIEHILSDLPMLAGESREEDLTRVLTSSPVTVHFRVDMRRQLVRVYAARIYR